MPIKFEYNGGRTPRTLDEHIAKMRAIQKKKKKLMNELANARNKLTNVINARPRGGKGEDAWFNKYHNAAAIVNSLKKNLENLN